MKKRIFVITSIAVVVIALCVIIPVVLASGKKDDVKYVGYSWSHVGTRSDIYSEYVDPAPNEKTLDMNEYAKGLKYKELNDETASELAKLTLSLFDRYDKILVRRTFYTDWLEGSRKKESPTNRMTDKVVVYCDAPTKEDHALVFLGLITELFEKDMYLGDQYGFEHMGEIDRGFTPFVVFKTNYKNQGFKTLESYLRRCDKIDDKLQKIYAEMMEYELKSTMLTKSEQKKYQQLEKKVEKLLAESDKLREGVYRIDVRYFRFSKCDDYFDESGLYIHNSEWKTVVELAEMQ